MIKKTPTNTKVFCSEDEESYEVEKIVNHRSINGKKQYKVIWAGYSFQQATWQPQENLINCAAKIIDFKKRFEEVMNKKKMMKLNPQPNSPIASEPKKPELQREKSSASLKMVNDKPQTSQQQKPLVTNPATVLNRERLQVSMQKNNLIPQKRPSEIETLKAKIMNPQVTPILHVSSDQLKITIPPNQQGQIRPFPNQNRQVINTADIFTSPKISTNSSNESKLNSSKESLNGSFELSNQSMSGVKVAKTQHLPQKTENSDKNQFPKIEDRDEERHVINANQSQQNDNFPERRGLRDVSFEMVARRNSEERKISNYFESSTMEMEEDQSEEIEDSDIFMRASERLAIEEICGVSGSGVGVQGGEESLRSQTEFLLVKNKYSAKEKWVQKERVIREDPMKLIEYYESLMMEMLGQQD